MKIVRAAVLIAVIAVIVCPQALYCAPSPDTLYYEVKLNGPTGDMGVRKMYMKGSYFLTESNITNETYAQMIFRVLKNKDGVFMIHPSNRYAAKYPPGSDRENPAVYLPGPTGDVKVFLSKHKAKKTGTEDVGSKKCDVYTYKEPVTTLDCKLWVDQKTGNPVKLQMKGKGGANSLQTATYVKYQIGASIPDSKFELPKNIPVRPMRTDRKTGAKPEKPAKSTN